MKERDIILSFFEGVVYFVYAHKTKDTYQFLGSTDSLCRPIEDSDKRPHSVPERNTSTYDKERGVLDTTPTLKGEPVLEGGRDKCRGPRPTPVREG